MNENLLYGLLRSIVSVIGIAIFLASLFVFGHAVGLFRGIEFGVSNEGQIQQTVLSPEKIPIQEPAVRDSLGVWSAYTDPPAREVRLNVDPQVAGNLTSAALGPVALKFDLSDTSLPRGLLWMLGGLAGSIVGMMFLALAFRRVEGAGRTVVLRGVNNVNGLGGGRVTMSMQSLIVLAETLAEQVHGVREARAIVRLKRAGWHVKCEVSHGPEDSVPEIASEVKQKIGDAFEHHTGLPVAKIDIAGQLGLHDAKRRVA